MRLRDSELIPQDLRRDLCKADVFAALAEGTAPRESLVEVLFDRLDADATGHARPLPAEVAQ